MNNFKKGETDNLGLYYVIKGQIGCYLENKEKKFDIINAYNQKLISNIIILRLENASENFLFLQIIPENFQ